MENILLASEMYAAVDMRSIGMLPPGVSPRTTRQMIDPRHPAEKLQACGDRNRAVGFGHTPQTLWTKLILSWQHNKPPQRMTTTESGFIGCYFGQAQRMKKGVGCIKSAHRTISNLPCSFPLSRRICLNKLLGWQPTSKELSVSELKGDGAALA